MGKLSPVGDFMSSRSSWTVLIVGVGCLALALASAAKSSAADNATSVWQGVYTKAQAERGRATYFAACVSCHGAQLQGDTDAPELAGNSFLKRWTDQPLGALFAFTESQMPVGRPRGLGAQGYADVIAHILASNGFPDGQQELPTSSLVLDKIMIDRKR
jgi:S-disulfanyl-L-cysteine oxidoreductase SoxD